MKGNGKDKDKDKFVINKDKMLDSKNTRFSKEELISLYKRNMVLSKLRSSKKNKLVISDLKNLIEARKTPTGRPERNYERSLRIIYDYLLGVPSEKSADREKITVDRVEETLRAYGLKFLKHEKSFINKYIEKKRLIKKSISNITNSNISEISKETGFSNEEVIEVVNETVIEKIESNASKVESSPVVDKSSIFGDTSFLNSNLNNVENSFRNSEVEEEKNRKLIESSETRKLNKKLFEKDSFDISSLDEYELELLDKQVADNKSRFDKLTDYSYSFEKYLSVTESDLEKHLFDNSSSLDSDELSNLKLELSLLKNSDFRNLLIKDLITDNSIFGDNAEFRSRLINNFKRGYYINFSRKLKLKSNFVSNGSDFIESDEGEESVYTNILKALDVIPQDSQLNLKNNLSSDTLSVIESIKDSGRLLDYYILEGNNLEIQELSVSDISLIRSDISFSASKFYKNSLSNAIKSGGHFILDVGSSFLILNDAENLPNYLIRGENLVLLKSESGLSNVERLTIRFNDCKVYDSILNNFSELNESLSFQVSESFISLKGVDLITDINSEVNVLPLLSETRSERTFLLFLRLALQYSAKTYGIDDYSSDSYLTTKYLLPIDIIIMKAINEMYNKQRISLKELSSRFCISPYLAMDVLNGTIDRTDFRVNYFYNISSYMKDSNNIESRS